MTNKIKSFGANTFAAGTFDPIFIEADGALGIAASTGVFTEIGNAVNLNIKMVASTGTFTETGNDANFNISSSNVTLTAETGEFTETGNDAAIVKGYSLNTETGEFTEAGNDVTFVKGYSIGAETGEFTETGNNTLGHRLFATTDTLTLAGNDVDLKKRKKGLRAGGGVTGDYRGIEKAGLAPKKRKRPEDEEEVKYGYIIETVFDGQVDIFASIVSGAQIEVLAEMTNSPNNGFNVTANVTMRASPKAVSAKIKRAA